MFLQRTQTVSFDPANKEHRAAARLYLKRKSWADSPLRFSHDATYGSVSSQVESKLLNWYADQEEAKLNKSKKVKEAAVGSKELAFAMMGIASEYPPLRKVG